MQRGTETYLQTALERIREVFYKQYNETKQILILTEQFANYSNIEVFFNFFGILEQIYQLMKNSNTSQDSIKKISLIDAYFITSQNYAIIASLIAHLELTKEDKFIQILNKNERDELRHKIKKLFKKYELINQSKNEVDINKLRDIFENDDFNQKRKINSDLKNIFWGILGKIYSTSQINEILKEMSLGIKLNKINMDYLKELNRIIIMDYGLCRKVILDLLIKNGYYYTFTVTEIRDAIDHFAKSILQENINTTYELSCIAEHLRRSCVEALNGFCKEKLNQILSSSIENETNIDFDKFSEVILDISIARYNKGNETWYKSIEYFLKAIKTLEELGLVDTHENTERPT